RCSCGGGNELWRPAQDNHQAGAADPRQLPAGPRGRVQERHGAVSRVHRGEPRQQPKVPDPVQGLSRMPHAAQAHGPRQLAQSRFPRRCCPRRRAARCRDKRGASVRV
ncbi:hypothetical protein H4R19_002161, partial [Coemansia spiralis]